MLPHILHTTTRAAAAVQPTQALRNVLQLQSSGPSSSSNSNRGNGTSSGGAKYNAGSRFHANYNNAGRAVTQANAITSYDGSGLQSDDTEDFSPRRPIRSTLPRQRFRSSSVSLSRIERDENMGVLKTIQKHARARHVLAPEESLALAKQRLLAEATPYSAETQQDTPLLIRRNSTSSPLSPLVSRAPSPAPPPPPPTELQENPPSKDEPVQVDPASPQTVSPPEAPEDLADPILQRLTEISDNKSATDYTRHMLSHNTDLNVDHFNTAFNTLIRTRISGEPLNPIIRLYNSMLERSVTPNVQTYELLIHAFTARDFEIQRSILNLDQRLKHVTLLSQDEVDTLESDKGRIEKLKLEDNFPSAMSLFRSILEVGGKQQLRLPTFLRLLRSCAYHSDVDSAVLVFGELERAEHVQPIHLAYQHMILTFTNARLLKHCELTFKTYRNACKEGRLGQHKGPAAEDGRHTQIQVWNAMIEAYFRFGRSDAAVGLVQEMLLTSSTNSFNVDEVPVPTSSAFATVIAGFILNGDVTSALDWFNRLLAEQKAPVNPFQGLDGKPMRPNSVAWHMMLDALAREGMVDSLNELYRRLQSIWKEDHINIRSADRYIVHRTNMDNLHKLPTDQALETLNWLVEDLRTPPLLSMPERWNFLTDLCVEYVKRKEYTAPFNMLSSFIAGKLEHIATQGESPSDFQRLELQHAYLTICETLYRNLKESNGELPWLPGLTAMRLGNVLGLQTQARFAPYIVSAYSTARYLGIIAYDDFRFEDWDVLLRFSAYLESNAARGNPDNLPLVPDKFGLGRVSTVLQDMASHGVTFDQFGQDIKLEVLQILETQYGGEQGRTEFLAKLGPSYAEAAQATDMLNFDTLQEELNRPLTPLLQAESSSLSASPTYSSLMANSDVTSVSSSSSASGLMIHGILTRTLGELLDLGQQQKGKVHQAYKLFQKNLWNRMVPEHTVIGRLIQVYGRWGDLEKVRELYTVAQDVFTLLDPSVQLDAWTCIEDSMIIALAHAGFPDAAHVHRMRILDQGRTPSADSYGVLIQHVKDTTDDTSGAMALFSEATERGVNMNLYLYNNIISKLSKARKAEYALELFQQMKAGHVVPSSITYGAVIGACARVGDVKSAELLFKEMTHSRNFRPRVPPYNTMMQLHTTTKPNRVSALHYYNELRAAGVRPSSHTYKLLMDTYGTIEPIDLPAMENVFHELQDDMTVELTGAHFASLINAYGCAAKDFDKAISTFETMSSTLRAPPPDAVVFEAVINVLIAHKRTELLPVYVQKMYEANVHMTAYIANFLIKGYANVGALEEARELFESLSDPECGVAAPNNHVPHNTVDAPEVHIMDPVYREPSTWETMVRAELGSGNREAALKLLERLKERKYPDAVYNRISGIMTDQTATIF